MMENPNQPTGMYPPEEEVHLQDYIEVLVRRRKVFVWAFCLVFLAVALYTFLASPVFEAQSTLHVRDDKVKGNGLLDDLGLSQENPVETEIEILRSRSNIEEVVRRLHLDWDVAEKDEDLEIKLREFRTNAEEPVYEIRFTGSDSYEVKGGDQGGPWKGQVGKRLRQGELTLFVEAKRAEKGDSFQLTQKSFNGTVQGLRSAIQASEVGKGTNIIRISYQHTDPVLARNVTNTLTQVYLERNVAVKSEEANKTVEFIGQQLNAVRETLDSAEKELANYKSGSGIVQIDSEATALIDLMSEGEKEWAALQLGIRQAGFATEAVQSALATGGVYAPGVFLQDPVVASIAENLAKLEVEKRGLLVDLTETHPQVQVLQDQVVQLQQKLLSTYRSMEEGMKKKADDLQKNLLRYEARLKKLPEVEQELARLIRRARVNSDIYTFLLQKHEEARVARAATLSNIEIVDPAIAPEKPVKPKKAKNLLLGMIVGLMLGVGLAFFQEYLDDTVKDGEGAKKILGFPVLASIPKIERKADEGSVEAKRARTLIAQFDPKSTATEAFRALRTAIHFSGLKRGKQVILVTSSFPGEGKTTVSGNLAAILTQAGARVLLIGCDLRKPTLHELFGLQRGTGLTELLAGDAKLSDVLAKTDVPGLDFLGSGSIPPNPAELLGSEEMAQFVEASKKDYDHIILDAPPFLAVTDSALLSRLANMVVVVMEAGRVPAKVARHLKDSLESCSAPVAGLILNDKTGKAAGYYGGYGYGRYGYQYGYGYAYGAEGEAAVRPWWRKWKK